MYELEISSKFLKNMSALTKSRIKLYLSLTFLKSKRGDSFIASYKDICFNTFDDSSSFSYNNLFNIQMGGNVILKSLKELESIGMIKVHPSTKKGKDNISRYEVF